MRDKISREKNRGIKYYFYLDLPLNKNLSVFFLFIVSCINSYTYTYPSIQLNFGLCSMSQFVVFVRANHAKSSYFVLLRHIDMFVPVCRTSNCV